MRELSKWAAILSLLATIGLAFVGALGAVIEAHYGLGPGEVSGPAMILALFGGAGTAMAFVFASEMN